jgi:hypothetical protein
MKTPAFPEGFPKNTRKALEGNTAQSPVRHEVEPKKTRITSEKTAITFSNG